VTSLVSAPAFMLLWYTSTGLRQDITREAAPSCTLKLAAATK